MPVTAVKAQKRRPRLSAADHARIALLRQEAEAERQLRAIERRADQIAEVRECMEDGYCLAAERQPDGMDRWEREELERLNCGRPPSRRCRTLPLRSYEAKHLAKYVET